jgi:nucleoside phosphorylase
MAEVLLVAATDLELCDQAGLVCGIGPVEAAVSVARELAVTTPSAVLHVGVAGGRRLTPGALVVGTAAIYADLSAGIPVVDRATPDPELVASAQAALPESISLPIATKAGVSGPDDAEHEFRVEAMEGFAVLRACELAGVRAVEVRAVCNEIGEGDRALWMMRRGLEVLTDAIPRLLAVISK